MGRRVIFGGGSLLIVALVALLAALSSGNTNDAALTPPQEPVDDGAVLPCTDLPPASAIAITQPGPEVPANLARFSGAWEGKAGNDYAALIVQQVNVKEAMSFYAFATLRGALVSQFQPDGSLHHGGTQQITFDWSFGQSPNVLKSIRSEGVSAVSYTMRRCTLQP